LAFNQPLGHWDVSHVVTMSGMFYGAVLFNQPLGQWDVSNVRDMSGMFQGATAFNQPLDRWTAVGSDTNVVGMCREAS
jgi:surface protein